MAWQPDYQTAEEFKTYANLDALDTVDDAIINLVITSASRAVDHETNRQFGLVDPAAARYYSYRYLDYLAGTCQQFLWIDDLMTTTSLVFKVDRDNDGVFEETLVNGTDFDFWPYNAATEGRPWLAAVMRQGKTLPVGPRRVEITAKWGWSAVPDSIKNATLVQAKRWYKRKDAAFGAAGASEYDNSVVMVSKFVEPDVKLMLRSFKRPWAVIS